ncbi:MAG: hypothetical protein VR73_02010 [Gammaproteobacteria bacterium BRH_c0]|nr:MAG: hypothetical protein VR73_02010 [Gammaproteobacteria bacterium BRH_c0]
MPRTFRLALLSVLLLLTACQSAYYGAMEKGGISKRELFVKRIEDVRDAQEDARQQLRATLEQLKYRVNLRGGKPEDALKQLNRDYDATEKAAGRIHNRIKAVESVSGALFAEWQDELDRYTNSSLRQQSQGQLDDTRKRYRAMLASSKKAEKSFAQVLATLSDSSLYLKHNLNAQGITALQYEFTTISNDINRLIKELDEAIATAERFMAEFDRQYLLDRAGTG